MNVFQWLYNFLKSMKTPQWLQDLLQKLFKDIVLPVLQQIGQDAINLLEKLIIKASKLDISNKEKAVWVYNEFRTTFNAEDIKDSALNLAIELLVNKLKTEGFIK